MASIARTAAQALRRVRVWATVTIQWVGFHFALRRFLTRHARVNDDKATVLIWDLGNFPGIIARNGVFATALKVRGERTHTVLCDGTPLACIRRGIEQPESLDEWSRRCDGCFRSAREVAKKYCLECSSVGD